MQFYTSSNKMKQELLELLKIVKDIVEYLYENTEDVYDLETIENIKERIRELEEKLLQQHQ